MSEIALVTSRKFKLESAAKKGSTNARKALELANNPNTFLSTVQIGITLIGILTGIFSGETITSTLRETLEGIDVLRPYAATLSVFIIVLVVTFFTIVLGELIPKRIGLMFPEKIASLVARPMTIISIITRPFIWLLTKTNDLILSLFGLKNRKENTISEEEIKAMVQESTESGEIQKIEQDIVHRVFALGDRRISELMTHRNDMVCLDLDDSISELKRKALSEPHAVYPVTSRESHSPVGIIAVKDVFPAVIDPDDFKLAAHVKQPLFVHEHSPAYRVLEKFRKSPTHVAFVVDEYGSVQGMVIMDDIVSALIGNVTELQHEYEFVQQDDQTWIADGGLPFFEFRELFKPGVAEDLGEYNTLAGYILDKLGHIPAQGEKLQTEEAYFEVMEMSGSKIEKVLVRKK